MRIVIVVPVVSLALALGGCATEHAGPVVTSAAVEEIRRANPGDPVEVLVPQEMPLDHDAPRSERHATLVAVTPQGVTLKLSAEAAPRVVPVGSVQRIVVTHRAEGAGIGAALGIAAGVVAAIVASATYTDRCAHSTSFGCVQVSESDVATLAGLVVGLPATLLGALIGAGVGTRTTYTFGEK
jgi:hypothetical protein